MPDNAPDPAPLREAIARIVDPIAWQLFDGNPEAAAFVGITTDLSFRKADEILAALPTDADQPVGGEPVTWRVEYRMPNGLMAGTSFFGSRAAVDFARSEATLETTVTPLYATAPTAGSGWLPIESAPKDGRHFLAHEDGGDVFRAAYHDEGYLMSFCGQPVVHTPDPTHWMPLPAAPTVGGE